jgi:hypothetical protein
VIAGKYSQEWPGVADHRRLTAPGVFATVSQAVKGGAAAISGRRKGKHRPIGVGGVVGCRDVQSEDSVNTSKFRQACGIRYGGIGVGSNDGLKGVGCSESVSRSSNENARRNNIGFHDSVSSGGRGDRTSIENK